MKKSLMEEAAEREVSSNLKYFIRQANSWRSSAFLGGQSYRVKYEDTRLWPVFHILFEQDQVLLDEGLLPVTATTHTAASDPLGSRGHLRMASALITILQLFSIRRPKGITVVSTAAIPLRWLNTHVSTSTWYSMEKEHSDSFDSSH